MAVSHELTDASEAVLAVALLRRRRDAHAELYRRHAAAVYALARRLHGDPYEAELLMRDVFIAMWRRVDDFRPGVEPARAFLIALTYQLAAERPGKEGSIQRQTLESAPQGASAILAANPRMVGRTSVPLKERVALLPSEEREPIELACFAGCTYSDVAMFLGETEANVKSRIRSGLRRVSSAE